jgi:predicted ATP-dependent serine protease
MTVNLDRKKLKPREVDTFVEACNLFELDMTDLFFLQKELKNKFSHDKQIKMYNKERKLVNRVKVTNLVILNRVGEFLMQKGSVDKALYLHKLVEKHKK